MGKEMSRMNEKPAKHRKSFNVLLLGLNRCGKSSLLSLLEGNSISEEYQPTEGFNVTKYVDRSYSKSSLFLWDLGGSQLQRKGWHYFYPSADGIIYIIDSEDRSNLEENKSQIESLFNNYILRRIPIIILAHKQDQVEAVTEIEMKKILELENYNSRLWRIFGTSLSCSSSLVSPLQVLMNGMERKYK